MDVQKSIPLPPNENQVHRNSKSPASQNPKHLESTRDQLSVSESACTKHSKESTSNKCKMQDHSDNSQNDDTEYSFKLESQAKSTGQKVFITEKGDVLHNSEAMKYIQASRKPETDTKSTENSKDIFISRGGEIQRGEEATIAKALNKIEKSHSRCRSFTMTLRYPKVEDTEQEDDIEINHETDDDTVSSVVSLHKLSEENENTHQKIYRDTAPQNGYCSSDDAQNDSNTHNCEGDDSSENDLSITNETDEQQVFVEAEIDINFSEDGYSSESSDYHRELEQITTCSSIIVKNCTSTQNDDIEQFSDTEEDDHRVLQQQHSSIIVKVNKHTKSRKTSSKEVLEAKRSIASSELRAAATDCKGISENVQCLATDTNVRGGEVHVATADTKLIDTKVKTGTVVTKVKGAEVKVATSDVKGLRAQAAASLDITTKASTTTAGQVELTGADVDIEATAEPTAQGVSVKTGTASVTGVQEKIKTDVKATTSGTKVQAGVADVTAVKFGATAEASVEATGLDVKMGTAQVSGVEVSATASASATTGTAVNIANARATAFDGIGARASLSAQSGVDLLNINVGISGNTGIKASTTLKVGCLSVAPGPPKLSVGTGIFSFGIGGGVEGQSGTYGGIATAGNPEGSSRHGNTGGGNAGDGEFSSHVSRPGNVQRNTSETSSVQGSSGLGGGAKGQSGTHAGITTMESLEGCSGVHIGCDQNTDNTEFSSHEVGLGSSTEKHGQETCSVQGSLSVLSTGPPCGSTGGASNSFTIQGNLNLRSETSHSHQRKEQASIQGTSIAPQSHDKLHKDKMVKSGSSDKQPCHLNFLQTLECKHLGDKKVSVPSCNGKAAVQTNVTGQQPSPSECDIQLYGTEAKLQAEINQLYPSACHALSGSSKQRVNKTVEQITQSTIRRLNSESKTGAHLPEPSSTTPTKHSINNPRTKIGKPFGENENIHDLSCCRMDSTKEIVEINPGLGGKIRGFKDQDD